MPPLSTAHLCDDGRMRTVGQMLEGISIELMPRDELNLHTLLFAFGVDWTHPLVPTMNKRGTARLTLFPTCRTGRTIGIKVGGPPFSGHPRIRRL